MENKINNGGAAFPVGYDINSGAVEHGMTLRDYFAAAALTGLLAARPAEWVEITPEDAAAKAIAFADAMIAARNK